MQKAARLSGVWIDMERVTAQKQLELTTSAFRDVAGNLGELRRRLILEERLAKDAVIGLRNDAIGIMPKPRKSGGRYLTKSYWRKRRDKLLKSIRKRIDNSVH